MKSEIDLNTTRVHSDNSIESKFAVCFIASVIRCEIIKACKAIGMDTNAAIQNLNRISFVLIHNFKKEHAVIREILGFSYDLNLKRLD